jgi:NADH-quinone oxidoreductase subunit C
MSVSLERLNALITEVLGDKLKQHQTALGEVTLSVSSKDYYSVAQTLKEHPQLCFDQLIDLCGVDYMDYKEGAPSAFSDGPRFAVVLHLLSVEHNWRVRLRVFAPDDEFPILPSVNSIWNSVNWFEREAFDLYGIIFEGHEDLRRLLTDYGFIGHPFRKDFPVSGHVEMRYDSELARVIYQPITIEPREITPRVVREEHYGGL